MDGHIISTFKCVSVGRGGEQTDEQTSFFGPDWGYISRPNAATFKFRSKTTEKILFYKIQTFWGVLVVHPMSQEDI